jgi:AmiR/NasT family two-component response regulator
MMNRKVIIVEDDFIIQMVLENFLLNTGCDVVGIASSSEEAIELISDNSLDLIFMDIGLSGTKNGIEVAAIVNDSCKTPIVFLTGNSDASTLNKMRNTNPLHIINKPVDKVSFLAHFTIICDKLKIVINQ